MRELGQILEEARQAKGLTLEQVESETHMRVKFLQALEQGQTDAFPTPLQMRGFLRNYARYLGLDPEPLLERYATNGNAPPSLPPPVNNEWRAMFLHPAEISPRRFSPFSWDFLLSVLILVAVAAFVVYYGSQLISGGLNLNLGLGLGGPTPAATATAPSTPLASVPQQATAIPPTATLPGQAAATPAQAAPPLPAGTLQLDLTASERTWVRITVDGQVTFEGLLAPAEHKSWQGQQSIQLLTGNAAGLSATLNGRPLGSLGARGQVVERTWTPAGEVTPTAMPVR